MKALKELKALHRRQMPAELINELFSALPLENAFDLLTKMPNGLLAGNVQKMFNGIKQEMKNNKFNQKDCSPILAIHGEGLVAIYNFSNIRGPNSVRAMLPIPSFIWHVKKPTIAFYYEMQILSKIPGCFIRF